MPTTIFGNQTQASTASNLTINASESLPSRLVGYDPILKTMTHVPNVGEMITSSSKTGTSQVMINTATKSLVYAPHLEDSITTTTDTSSSNPVVFNSTTKVFNHATLPDCCTQVIPVSDIKPRLTQSMLLNPPVGFFDSLGKINSDGTFSSLVDIRGIAAVNTSLFNLGGHISSRQLMRIKNFSYVTIVLEEGSVSAETMLPLMALITTPEVFNAATNVTNMLNNGGMTSFMTNTQTIFYTTAGPNFTLNTPSNLASFTMSSGFYIQFGWNATNFETTLVNSSGLVIIKSLFSSAVLDFTKPLMMSIVPRSNTPNWRFTQGMPYKGALTSLVDIMTSPANTLPESTTPSLGKLADNSALTFSTGSGIHRRLASYEENVLVPLSGLNQGTIVKLDSGEVHLATSTGSTQLTLTAGTANAIPRWSTASSKYLPSTTASLGLATDSSSGAVILNGTSTALTVSVPGLIATPVRLSNVVTTFPLRYSTADKEITYSENEYGSGTILTDRRMFLFGSIYPNVNSYYDTAVNMTSEDTRFQSGVVDSVKENRAFLTSEVMMNLKSTGYYMTFLVVSGSATPTTFPLAVMLTKTSEFVSAANIYAASASGVYAELTTSSIGYYSLNSATLKSGTVDGTNATTLSSGQLFQIGWDSNNLEIIRLTSDGATILNKGKITGLGMTFTAGDMNLLVCPLSSAFVFSISPTSYSYAGTLTVASLIDKTGRVGTTNTKGAANIAVETVTSMPLYAKASSRYVPFLTIEYKPKLPSDAATFGRAIVTPDNEVFIANGTNWLKFTTTVV